MSIRLFLARLTGKVVVAAAVGVAVSAGGSASAADVVPPPAAGVSVFDTSPLPPLPAGLSCETCKPVGHGHVFKGGLGGHLSHKKGPYPVHLCPGSCFGYFQTQWRKWEDVCPYPYAGSGSAIPAVGTPLPPSGAPLTPPRPIDKGDPKMPDPKKPDPKKFGGSDLPLIPVPVSGKPPR